MIININKHKIIVSSYINMKISFFCLIFISFVQMSLCPAHAQSTSNIDQRWAEFQIQARNPSNDQATLIAEMEVMAESGYAPATIFLARFYIGKEQGRLRGRLNELLADAIPRLQADVRQVNHQAHLALSLAYRFGYGVEKNDIEKTRLLEIPFKAGNPQAIEWIISDFTKGSGVPQSRSLALDIAYRHWKDLTENGFNPQLGLLALLLVDFSKWTDSEKQKIYYIINNYDPTDNATYSMKKFFLSNQYGNSSIRIYSEFDLSIYTILSGGDLHKYPSEKINEFTQIKTHQFEIYNCGKKFPFDLRSHIREIPIDMKNKKMLAARISCHLDADSPLFSPDEVDFYLDRYKSNLGHYENWIKGLQKLYHPKNKEDNESAFDYLERGILKSNHPDENVKYYLLAKILDESKKYSEAGKYYLKSGIACFRAVEAAENGKHSLNIKSAADPSEAAIAYYYEPGINPLTGFFTMDTDIATAQCTEAALSRALDLGEAEAALYLANLPENARGISGKFLGQRKTLLERAVKEGVVGAYPAFALSRKNSGSIPLSERIRLFNLLKIGDKAENLSSKYALHLFMLDPTISGDREHAFRILREAAEKDHGPSQLLLGKYLIADQNELLHDEGKRWLDKALSNHEVEAEFEIALFEKSKNNANLSSILKKLYSSTQQNVQGARYALADAIEKGEGLEAPSPWLASIWRTGQLP